MVQIGLTTYSSNISSLEERFGEQQKFWAHIFIIFIVILATIYTFYSADNTNIVDINYKSKNDSIYHYKVAIPYIDRSLINNLGYDKIGDKKFVYISDVKSANENDAIDSAINKFWKDTLISPTINTKNVPKKQLLKVEKDFIIAKLLK